MTHGAARVFGLFLKILFNYKLNRFRWILSFIVGNEVWRRMELYGDLLKFGKLWRCTMWDEMTSPTLCSAECRGPKRINFQQSGEANKWLHSHLNSVRLLKCSRLEVFVGCTGGRFSEEFGRTAKLKTIPGMLVIFPKNPNISRFFSKLKIFERQEDYSNWIIEF